MYAVLLNGGRLPTLRFTDETPATPALGASMTAGPAGGQLPSAQLLSPEASYITLDMLEKNPRPDTGQPASPAVAWKTGTSWGFHDAWSVGVFDRYVLVVWIGNFDNTGNPAFVGVQAGGAPAVSNDRCLAQPGSRSSRTTAAEPRAAGAGRCVRGQRRFTERECPQTVATWYIPASRRFGCRICIGASTWMRPVTGYAIRVPAYMKRCTSSGVPTC